MSKENNISSISAKLSKEESLTKEAFIEACGVTLENYKDFSLQTRTVIEGDKVWNEFRVVKNTQTSCSTCVYCLPSLESYSTLTNFFCNSLLIDLRENRETFSCSNWRQRE